MGRELEIGNNIKGLRDKAGLNQRQFAEKIGSFSADYLRKIERGDLKEPKYDYLIAIAKVCECSVDYILTGIEIPDNQNMNMQTESAKEAINHLNKCAHSIKKLDEEVLDLKALEARASELRSDPQTSSVIKIIRENRMGVMS